VADDGLAIAGAAPVLDLCRATVNRPLDALLVCNSKTASEIASSQKLQANVSFVAVIPSFRPEAFACHVD
jgi:hypothetical protein